MSQLPPRPQPPTASSAVPPTTQPSSTTPEASAHAEKMARIKAARDRMMEGKTGEKGLVLVLTGKGKGKSSSAFGMVMRCLGHGMRVGIVQFIKGAWETGEAKFLRRFPEEVEIKTLGEGFSWETQDRARDVAAAERAWAEARRMLADPRYDFVLLDEINVALRYEQIPLDPVLEALAARPPMQHAVLTGRNAPERLVELADLVTDMTLVKHPFRSGVKAQKGLEF
ncbi:MAG: cob(I)yrinic acid a,c-diamide adenosyltransferase [Alphaproteobacteria bacterium]|nr:cob(I)yrinic acid a,c-diamide adenosyltransferase [Alphaproteobacteria bacterium]